MDKIKSEDGFTILETLVSFLILGILAVVIFTILSNLYTNPALVLKQEAFSLASNEINYSMFNTVGDTSYFSEHKNLIIERNIIKENGLDEIIIKVTHKQSKRLLVELEAYKKNNN